MSDESNTVAELVVTAPAPLPAPPPRQVKVYAPRISVVLTKAINRRDIATGVPAAARIQGADNASIDLAAFLGEGCGVTVRRTVRGADTGMFSIRLPDKLVAGQMESIYGLVEPMDAIEIRMARSPKSDGTSDLPIVLRGFVSEISRGEAMTPRGPARFISITGHDYGKILQIMRVIYLPTMIVGQDLLTAFNLFLNYDVDAKNYTTAAEFIAEVMKKAVQPFLTRMQGATGGGRSPVMQMQFEATSPSATSNVSPFGTQGWEGGTFFDLLAQFGDVGPWQELYVEDRKDAPYLVYRPAPFKDASGALIQPEVASLPTPVATTLVEGADVISLNVTRSDANVGNYFWVDAPSYQLIGSPIMQQDGALQPAPALNDYQNCDPRVFGIRLLRTSTNQGGRYDGQPEADLTFGDEDAMNLNNEKRRILIDSNKDNVVFEAGQMRLKGNEAITAGSYIRVRRGDLVASYYGHTVQHDYVFGGGFTTSVDFDRGTGFIERAQREGVSAAYLQEIGRGA